MVVITNQTAVACPPEELFDYCVDICNEVEWNHPSPGSIELEALNLDRRRRSLPAGQELRADAHRAVGQLLH